MAPTTTCRTCGKKPGQGTLADVAAEYAKLEIWVELAADVADEPCPTCAEIREEDES